MVTNTNKRQGGREGYSWSIQPTDLERARPGCGTSLLDLLDSPGRCRRIPAAPVAMFVSELLSYCWAWVLLQLSFVRREVAATEHLTA